MVAFLRKRCKRKRRFYKSLTRIYKKYACLYTHIVIYNIIYILYIYTIRLQYINKYYIHNFQYFTNGQNVNGGVNLG